MKPAAVAGTAVGSGAAAPLPSQSRVNGLLDVASGRTGHANGSVVLVSAPAGTGKTTQIARWLATLDDTIVATTQVARPERVVGMWRSLRTQIAAQTYPAGTRAAIARPSLSRRRDELSFPEDADWVERELAAIDRQVVIVIDDAHGLSDPLSMHSVQTFLDAIPQHVSVVLIARHDPPLAWHRYASERRFTRIGTAEMSLTDDETTAVLRATGTEVTSGQVTRVRELTRGWITLVLIAADHLAGRRDVAQALAELEASTQPVSDLLVGAMIARLPVHLREFAATTAVLPDFDVDLATHVSGQDAAAAVTELVGAGFPVVPAGSMGSPAQDGGGYTYPGLIRVHLVAELRRTGPGAVDDAYLRAIAWSSRHQRHGDALRQALMFGDPEVLAATLMTSGAGMVLAGEIDAFEPMLDDCCHVLADTAIVMLLRALVALEIGDTNCAAIHLENAGIASPQLTDLVSQPDDVGLLYRILLLQLAAYRPIGDLDALIRSVVSPPPSGTTPAMRALALMTIGSTFIGLGELDRAETVLTSAIAIAETSAQDLLRARILERRAAASGQRGDNLVMLRYSRSAIALAGTTEPSTTGPSTRHIVARCRAKIAYAQYLTGEPYDPSLDDGDLASGPSPGGLVDVADARTELLMLVARFRETDHRAMVADRARRVLATMLAKAGPDLGPARSSVLLPRVAHMCAAVGHPDRIFELVETAEHASGPQWETTLATVIARCAQGRFESARTILGPMLGNTGRMHPVTGVSVGVLDAYIGVARDDEHACHRGLETALSIAEPMRLVAPFLEGGRAIADALARHSGSLGYLDGFADHVRRLSHDRSGPDEVHLTPSEMRVLHCLPSGRTAEEMAEILSVSVNTVKTHLRAIYRKLGVGTRRDAVVAARSAGLI
ncbi:LuxR C-terminal-related transcriptional regulator [Gordonia rhizosphera]|uniref:LuxR C-terminal-related transcriptional regulator n=1 Tax=Gordonia rhizosphera TaxID=83341 RepID=UPI000315A643|nr:LuxR C-terminal-related transcriptional regulator [Gordonia rhizosphera]